MQNPTFTRQAPAPGMGSRARQRDLDWCADDQFISMRVFYRGSGGLAQAPELLALFKRHAGPNVATLARWIVERQVIGFEWQRQTWFPLFQFSRQDLAPDPRLRPVFAELTGVYDAWELANWFARPNPWLTDRVPVDTLDSDRAAVLYAARADRFVAHG